MSDSPLDFVCACLAVIEERHKGHITLAHAITHHFSTGLLSTSNSTLIPYLNTDSPFAHGFPSYNLQSSSTAFITQPSINMSNPNDLRSVFEDTSDIEMEDLAVL